MPRNRRIPVDLGQALIEAYLVNERINQVLLDLIPEEIWRVSPACSKRRNIATTFAHIHNVRVMRLKMSAKGFPVPERLNRAQVTPDEARYGLRSSSAALVDLIKRSLQSDGHVKAYRPDVVALVCAGITHEAHHRGQVTHWVRELGHPISSEDQLKLWEWDRIWKDVVS